MTERRSEQIDPGIHMEISSKSLDWLPMGNHCNGETGWVGQQQMSLAGSHPGQEGFLGLGDEGIWSESTGQGAGGRGCREEKEALRADEPQGNHVGNEWNPYQDMWNMGALGWERESAWSWLGQEVSHGTWQTTLSSLFLPL